MATDGKPRSWKWLIILLLLAGAIGGAVWYWGSDHTPPEYQTATVTRGDLVQSVTATGTLNPVMNVQVGSQISGNIQKLNADFNSTVKEGQVIAELDPATYQANVHQAEAELANAVSARELAKVNARRQQELRAGKISSQSELDTA